MKLTGWVLVLSLFIATPASAVGLRFSWDRNSPEQEAAEGFEYCVYAEILPDELPGRGWEVYCGRDNVVIRDGFAEGHYMFELLARDGDGMSPLVFLSIDVSDSGVQGAPSPPGRLRISVVE